MKKIVCELCEGMEFTKSDGMFVCNECGTRYTLEEAKALMKEVDGEAAPISGKSSIPVVDSSEKIEKMMINAKRAYDDGKYPQAEQLYGQVLNEDPDNVTAILYEGLSLGWQGNTVKYTMSQAHDAAIRALTYAHQQMGDSVNFKVFYDITLVEMINLGSALMKLCQQNRKEAAERFTRQMNDLTRRVNALPFGVDPSFLQREANQDKAHYEEQETKFKKIQDNTLLLVLYIYEKVAELVSNTEFYTKDDYKKLKDQLKDLKECALFDVTKRKAQDIMNKFELYVKKISAAEEEARKLAIENYWKEHKEEKDALDAERETLQAEKQGIDEKLAEYNAKITATKKEGTEKVPAEMEQEDFKKEMSALIYEKADLGLFKIKEKKALDEKIEVLRIRIEALDAKVKTQKEELQKVTHSKYTALRVEMKPLEDRKREIIIRMEEIEKEFKKDR